MNENTNLLCDGHVVNKNSSLNEWSAFCAAVRKDKQFVTELDNLPEKLLLVITEVAEATEALRKKPIDFEGFHEEIADTFIRLFDICGSVGIDLEKVMVEKMHANMKRPPLHGKRF